MVVRKRPVAHGEILTRMNMPIRQKPPAQEMGQMVPLGLAAIVLESVVSQRGSGTSISRSRYASQKLFDGRRQQSKVSHATGEPAPHIQAMEHEVITFPDWFSVA
jgi:hypothetical protein